MRIVKANSNASLKIARLLSNIFHPWVVLVPVLASAAYQTTGNYHECIKWTLAAYLPALLFPVLYAKIKAMILSRKGSRQRVSRSLFRDDPTQLLIMSGLFGIPSILILHYFNGPGSLLTIMLGCSVVMFVIATVNLEYRASFHLSMIASMLTSLWFFYGPVSLATFLLIPVLGFSRYQMGEHTINQMVTGFLIGLVVSGTIFYRLGLGV